VRVLTHCLGRMGGLKRPPLRYAGKVCGLRIRQFNEGDGPGCACGVGSGRGRVWSERDGRWIEGVGERNINAWYG
jgi:hypothetical protein